MNNKKMMMFEILSASLGGGGADVSVVTATAPDVDEGKVFVDSSGSTVTGTSTYKADYIALSDNIDDLNEDLEEVITGDGTGGGLTVNSVKGLIDGTATTFTIPEGATSIAEHKFRNMDNLTNVNFPNTVTSIGGYAFTGCTSLALTSLPSSLTSIDSSAFSNCNNLTLSSFPINLNTIGNYAFISCYQLAIPDIPSSVTSIGSNAFANNNATKTVTFLGTPTSISSSAFPNPAITTIRVPWAEGEVANAPWGAVNASIIYGYTPA